MYGKYQSNDWCSYPQEHIGTLKGWACQAVYCQSQLWEYIRALNWSSSSCVLLQLGAPIIWLALPWHEVLQQLECWSDECRSQHQSPLLWCTSMAGSADQLINSQPWAHWAYSLLLASSGEAQVHENLNKRRTVPYSRFCFSASYKLYLLLKSVWLNDSVRQCNVLVNLIWHTMHHGINSLMEWQNIQAMGKNITKALQAPVWLSTMQESWNDKKPVSSQRNWLLARSIPVKT